MTVYTQLIGISPNEQILTAVMKLVISIDGKQAFVTLKNISPSIKDTLKPIINSFFLKVNGHSEHDITIQCADQNDWIIECKASGTERQNDKVQFIFKMKDENVGLLPNETLSFTLIINRPDSQFIENDFLYKSSTNPENEDYQAGVTFIEKNRKVLEESTALEGYFMLQSNETTTPSPPSLPIFNPQSYGQITLEGTTQLVGPALYDPNEPSLFPINPTKEINTWIEKVCPGKVIIGGFVRKTILYKVLDYQGQIKDGKTIDDIPIQCVIDRDDANEGDKYEIVGAAVLSSVNAHPAHLGIHPDYKKPIAWKFLENEIVIICIRKRFTSFNDGDFHQLV